MGPASVEQHTVAASEEAFEAVVRIEAEEGRRIAAALVAGIGPLASVQTAPEALEPALVAGMTLEGPLWAAVTSSELHSVESFVGIVMVGLRSFRGRSAGDPQISRSG